VRPGASHDEIARAYRRLAHDVHPDTHPGDPDAARRFRVITEAYEVLGNPDRRARYDGARSHCGTDLTSSAERLRPMPPPLSSSPPVSGGPAVYLGTGPATGPATGLATGLPQWLSAGPVQGGPMRRPAPPPLGEALGGEGDVAAGLLRRLLTDIFEVWLGP
jgi:curved DNA-binding protein CbpA